MSTIRFDTWQNVGGTAEYYKCRAWVNFNGTGTVAIRSAGNVSSITDNAVGDYTVNLTTAMPDINYSVSGLAGPTAITGGVRSCIMLFSSNGNNNRVAPTVSNFKIVTVTDDGTAYVDSLDVHLSIFR